MRNHPNLVAYNSDDLLVLWFCGFLADASAGAALAHYHGCMCLGCEAQAGLPHTFDTGCWLLAGTLEFFSMCLPVPHWDRLAFSHWDPGVLLHVSVQNIMLNIIVSVNHREG